MIFNLNAPVIWYASESRHMNLKIDSEWVHGGESLKYIPELVGAFKDMLKEHLKQLICNEIVCKSLNCLVIGFCCPFIFLT